MYKSLLTDMIGIDTSLEGAIALAENSLGAAIGSLAGGWAPDQR